MLRSQRWSAQPGQVAEGQTLYRGMPERRLWSPGTSMGVSSRLNEGGEEASVSRTLSSIWRKTPKDIWSTESMFSCVSHRVLCPTCGISRKSPGSPAGRNYCIHYGRMETQQDEVIYPRSYSYHEIWLNFKLTRSSFTAGCMPPGSRKGHMGKEKEKEG